jgi:hypothetical protein
MVELGSVPLQFKYLCTFAKNLRKFAITEEARLWLEKFSPWTIQREKRKVVQGRE